MKQETYSVILGHSLMVYEFWSEGPKGSIPKIVVFSDFGDGYYNLAFGDKFPEKDDFSDEARSNNGDADKVLATVVLAVFYFLEHFPDAFVVAAGSTAERTRLYRIGISRFLDQIPPELEVFGLLDGEWEPFRIGGNYLAFGIRIRPP